MDMPMMAAGGKPSIAIALSIQKKNKKKMAEGGKITDESHNMSGSDSVGMNVTPEEMAMIHTHRKMMAEGGAISASDEMRPMPENEYNDKAEAGRNSGMKKPGMDSWSDTGPEKDASESGSMMSNEADANWMNEGMANADNQKRKESMRMDKHMDSADVSDDDQPQSVADAVMRKRTKLMLSEGGDVSDGKQRQDNERGINKPAFDTYHQGTSQAGRDAKYGGSYMQAVAKGKHSKTLEEMRSMKKPNLYADGGEVDLDQNAREHKNSEDDDSFDALKKENYSESDGLDELSNPMDSGQDGDDDLERDKHDMISAIRRKMRMKSMR
ncbi:unnamed protein product [Sphagnum balticum]